MPSSNDGQEEDIMESRRSASMECWYRGTDWILYVLAPKQGVGYLSRRLGKKKKKASKGKAIKRNQTLAIKNKHARKSTARKLKPQPGQQPTRPVGN
jgi:hypothetical protein